MNSHTPALSQLELHPLLQDDRWETHIPNLTSLPELFSDSFPDYPWGEVSLVFSNDDEVRNLNHTYRHKNTPTNVLSFPMNEHGMMGDVILAYETCLKESLEQSKEFRHHVTHLIVHGILHLMGYDHETDEEADEMESIEVKVLKSLGIPNPYNP